MTKFTVVKEKKIRRTGLKEFFFKKIKGKSFPVFKRGGLSKGIRRRLGEKNIYIKR